MYYNSYIRDVQERRKMETNQQFEVKNNVN